MNNWEIRKMLPEEVDAVANFIAKGYADDQFFHWCVDNDVNQEEIVTKYYQVYLRAKGAKVNIAVDNKGNLLGASVWLPHDVDETIYEEIDRVVEKHQDRFAMVADKSHANEPKNQVFYQLVGIVTDKKAQGQGIGAALLKYQLDQIDQLGIATYLEASTKYDGAGIYGKFGYQYFGDIMNFEDKTYLYPLYRKAGGND